MRLSYRLNLSLIAGVALTSLAFTLYQTVVETRGLREDVKRHAVVLAQSLERPALAMLEKDATNELLPLVDRFSRSSGLTGVAVYS